MDPKEKTLYMIGNAHIDPVWLWQWQEGFQEVKATFRSALDRMKEYPDFVFTNSSAAYYAWVERNDMEMFEEIRHRIQEGRWVIVGGWWVQPDCNIPCGESFVRQALYAQRYFYEKFGVMAKTGYNVDSFGHNGMLPQILKKSGMSRYVFLRPGRHEKALPSPLFRWRSPDGSEISAFRILFEYGSWGEALENHVRRCAGEIKECGGNVMCFYGVGNHGGGPTKKNIESIRQMMENPALPTLIFASPDQFFDNVEKAETFLPVVEGELLHHASGCYSAHSEIKRLNRKAENRLLTAEKFSVIAHRMTGQPYPLDAYTRAWKDVLFQQFHDIMAGTSIEPAYEDAKEAYGSALHAAAIGMNDAVQALSWRIHIPMEEGMKPLVVFNPHSFGAKMEVEIETSGLPAGTVLLDDEERQIPYQLVQSAAAANGRYRMCFVADLPPMGYRTYRLAQRKQTVAVACVPSTDTIMENRWFRVEFDPVTGYLSSLTKKSDGAVLFSGPAAVPVVMEDDSDTWSHAVLRFDKKIGEFRAIRVRRVEYGPVKSVIRVTSVYGESRLIQDFALYQELDYITVKTTVEWHEKSKLLKLQFPMNLNYFRGSYEIPYGTAQRQPNGEEFPVQSWMDFEGSNGGQESRCFGMSVLNDGKYSCSAEKKLVSLTVLRSPIYAHHEPFIPDENMEYTYIDNGKQQFTYALYPHEGSWEDADTVHHALVLNQKPVALFETFHEGPLEQKGSFLEVSAANIVVSVWKESEDGSGDIILRAHETAGRHTRTTISLPLLERKIDGCFGPWEIKTFRIPRDGGQDILETDLLERRISAEDTAEK